VRRQDILCRWKDGLCRLLQKLRWRATSGPRHISVDGNKHRPNFFNHRVRRLQIGPERCSKMVMLLSSKSHPLHPPPQETAPSAVKVAHAQKSKEEIVVSSSAFSEA